LKKGRKRTLQKYLPSQKGIFERVKNGFVPAEDQPGTDGEGAAGAAAAIFFNDA